MRAFERQPRESTPAFEAFKTYRDLGPGRSLDVAYRLHTGRQESAKQAPGRWTKWSMDHDWVARVQSFDDYREMIRRDAVEEHERTKGTELAERESRIQERVQSLKEQFIGRLEEMLGCPLQMDKWNYAAVSKAIETLEGRYQRIDLRKINFDALTDHQLERIANGDDPLQVVLEGQNQDEEGKGAG